MKVYVVTQHWPFDGSNTVEVHLTEINASERCNELNTKAGKSYESPYYDYEEYEVIE